MTLISGFVSGPLLSYRMAEAVRARLSYRTWSTPLPPTPPESLPGYPTESSFALHHNRS